MTNVTWGAPSNRTGLGDERVRGVGFVVVMAAVMWVIEVVNATSGGDLDRYGIRPRHFAGLDGIAFAPFLHASWHHLIGNTVPFVILGAIIALSGLARIIAVTVIVALVGGLGTWLIAPANSIHIGASGVVFGYATYLIARFWYSRETIHIVGGIVVIAIWGATLLGGLIPHDGISWQGHLFGGVGGVVAAAVLDRRTRP
ncbi:MAG: rhomboid family intramembrane serine protease [Solirubrobacteraceae bacterium]|nr:rhomboid family intramembrane serine protease [Patulibacter sp.]